MTVNPMHSVPKPYKRNNKINCNYKSKFMLPDKSRIEIDLGTNNLIDAKNKAREIYKNYSEYFKIDKPFTLANLITSYCNPYTNPKLLDSKETDKTYKSGTILLMTRSAKDNFELLSKKAILLMQTKISDLTRIDIIWLCLTISVETLLFIC